MLFRVMVPPEELRPNIAGEMLGMFVISLLEATGSVIVMAAGAPVSGVLLLILAFLNVAIFLRLCVLRPGAVTPSMRDVVMNWVCVFNPALVLFLLACCAARW